jgi:hypothetical protein
MKYLMAGLLALLCGFFLADFLFRQQTSDVKTAGMIPFDHSLHGDSIGLDCSHCHMGVAYQSHAYMPSKADCLDCHRLPLTEKPNIERLDSILPSAEDFPWIHKSVLPEHVVFHHGVHYVAQVKCADCHGPMDKIGNNLYGGERFTMQKCLECHSGKSFKDRGFKKAAVHCGACHR